MKKWAIWKTISVVIASIMFVSGVAVLGVYFAGGFKNSKISPDTISLEAVDEGLFNSQAGQNGRYEVVGSFQMVVNGQTQNGKPITNSTVTLSLNDGEPYFEESLQNGVSVRREMIGNGVISVPKYVTIGQPFVVQANVGKLKNDDGSDYLENELGEEDVNGENVYDVVGGLATITAQIENLYDSKEIAVDTPVHKIIVSATSLDGQKEFAPDKIILGEPFTLKLKFIPSQSEYLYNDPTRSKLFVFDTGDGRNVSADFDSTLGQIGQRFFSPINLAENSTISAYAFAHADAQLTEFQRILSSIGGQETAPQWETLTEQEKISVYDQLVAYLRDTEGAGRAGEYSFSIKEASIDTFTVSESGKSWEMILGQNFTISMQHSDYADAFLGAQVWTTEGDEITSLLSHIAIGFEYRENDGAPWQKVTADMIKVNQNQAADYTDEQGREFYLPNTTPKNPIYYYWTINSSLTNDTSFRILILYLEELSDGGYQPMKVTESENKMYTISLQAKLSDDEPIEWENTQNINETLSYDGQTITPLLLHLPEVIIPQDNQFKTLRYLVHFTHDETDEQIKGILGDKGNKDDPNNHIGEYMIDNQALTLYPLERIDLYNVGRFEVFAATIETAPDGSDVVQEDGLLRIVRITRAAISVMVTKTLHEGSFTRLRIGFESALVEPEAGGAAYNIYSGSNSTLSIMFAIAEDSVEVVEQKIDADAFDVDLFDQTGTSMKSMFTGFDEFELIEEENQRFLKVSLVVNEKFGDFDDHILSKITLTDNANDELEPWEFTVWVDEAGGAGPRFVFYTPTVDKITVAMAESSTFGGDFDKNQYVVVTQALSETDGTTQNIRYNCGTDDSEEESLEFDGTISEFLNNFSITIIDQHGRENLDQLKDNWAYDTDAVGVVSIRDGREVSFLNVSNATAKLWIKAKDNNVSTQGEDDESFVLQFKITSSTITKIEYDDSENPTTPTVLSENKDAEGNPILDKIEMQKVGAKNGTINFENSIKLYLDGTNTYTPAIHFSLDYLDSLDETDIEALYGENGMIEVAGLAGEGTLKQRLLQTDVQTLTFRHDFMQSGHKIGLVVGDKGGLGILNISLNLTILGNVTIHGHKNFDIYASAPEFLGKDDITIEYKYGNESQSLAQLLAEKENYYIVKENEFGTSYVLSTQSTGKAGVVAKQTVKEENKEIQLGGFNFDDFWDASSKQFNVMFYFGEDGVQNKFAPFYNFQINVKRNIKAENVKNGDAQTDKSYKYTDNSQNRNEIKNYISISRAAGDRALPTIIYKFETENSYFTIDGEVFKPKESIPLFQPNQFEFVFSIQVYAGVEDERNLINTIQLKFEPGISYEDVAKRLLVKAEDSADNVCATIDQYDGIKFVKVTEGRSWQFKNDGENFKLSAVRQIYDAVNLKTWRPDYRSLYINTDSDSIVFQADSSAQTKYPAFFDLGNLNKLGNFMIVQVEDIYSDGVSFYMLVPVVVSRIGLVNGVFNDGTTKAEASLADLTSDEIAAEVEGLVNDGKYYQTSEREIQLVYGYEKEKNYTNSEKPGIHYLTDVNGQQNHSMIEVIATYTAARVEGGRYRLTLLDENNFASIITQEAGNQIHFKHLVGGEKDARFVLFRITITRAGGDMSQTLYYIVKVLPDSTIEDVVYPYVDEAEYIAADIGTAWEDDLDQEFGDEAERSGKYRFNVKVNGVAAGLDDLGTSTFASKVTTDGGLTANSGDVTIVFSTDKEGHSHISITPKREGKYQIEITRTYSNLAGGTITYKFVLNDPGSDYSIEFESEAGKPTVNDEGDLNYSVTLEKSGKDDKYVDISLNYLRKTLAGATQDSKIYDQLYVHGAAHLPEMTFDQTSFDIINGKASNTGENQIYAYYLYNNSNQAKIYQSKIEAAEDDEDFEEAELTLASNTLRIYFVDYLEEDKSANLYIYSKYGCLGTLQLNLKGSVHWSLIGASADETTCAAGQAFELKTIIKEIKLYNTDPYTHSDLAAVPEVATDEEAEGKEPENQYGFMLHSVDKVVYDDEKKTDVTDKNLVKFGADENFNKLTILPSIKPMIATISAKIWLAQVIEWPTEAEQPTTEYRILNKYDEFSFTFTLKITASVKNATDTSLADNTQDNAETVRRSSSDVYAASSFTISPSALANGIDATKATFKYTWSALSGGQAFENGTGESITVKTSETASAVSAIMLIKIDLCADKTSDAYQTFFVKYSFTIQPNKTVSTNYPVPAGSELEVEYFEGGKTISVSDILIGKAPFADNPRFEVKRSGDTSALTGDQVKADAKIQLKLVRLQNASVTAGSKTYSTDEDGNVIYDGTLGTLNTELTFTRGTSGEIPLITVQLFYDGVPYPDTYTFQIVDRLYGITLQRTTAVTEEGETETFYVDKLSASTKIFEENRLAKFTIASTAANLLSTSASQVYLVFEKVGEDSYSYKTIQIKLSSADLNDTLTLDLGESLKGFTLVGAYLNDPNIDESLTTKQTSSEVDRKYDLFGDTFTLTSRALLTYNGIVVNYNKAALKQGGNMLSQYSISPDLGSRQITITYSDESAGVAVEKARATYSYALDVDIEMPGEVTFTGAGSEMTADVTVDSIVDGQNVKMLNFFGVYRPSDNSKYTADDFKDASDPTISLEVVGLNTSYSYVGSDDKLNAIGAAKIGQGSTTFAEDGIFTPYKDLKQYRYLDISADLSGEQVTDYTISALGAKNLGNYVLLKLTYQISVKIDGVDKNYPKEFYKVVQVLPDYQITYSVPTTVEADENGVYSNDGENEIYNVHAVTESGKTYQDVVIAGVIGADVKADNPERVVTVVHKNQTSQDVGAQEFTYKLKKDYQPDGSPVQYNEGNNVDKKLGSALAQEHWSKEGDAYTWADRTDNASLTLKGIDIVQFATQLYYLQAEDDYGYKFDVCFKLTGVSSGEPQIVDGATLTENLPFDIGIMHNLLELSANDEDKIIVASGASEMLAAQKERGLAEQAIGLISVEGIDAWGFGENYSSYLDYVDGEWVGKEVYSDYKLDQIKEFLTMPIFTRLHVLSITFSRDGEQLASIEASDAVLKTEQMIILSEDGPDKNQTGIPYQAAYTLPRLKSSIYGDSSEAEVDVVIQIGYTEDGSIPSNGVYEEYYQLQGVVRVLRNISIDQKGDNIVRDGETFDIDNYIRVKESQNNGEIYTLSSSDSAALGAKEYRIYDDTLEITVPGNGIVEFTLNFNSQDKDSVIIRNEDSFERVYYRSISTIVGQTLKGGDVVTLESFTTTKIGSSASAIDNATFKYGSRGIALGDTITIASIKQDSLAIANSASIGKNVKRMSVNQYYVISVNKQSAESSDTQTVEYKFTQTYLLTRKYYSMSYNYVGQRKFVNNYLTVTPDGKDPYYVIPIEAWAEGMTLNKLVYDNGAYLDNVAVDSFSPDAIYRSDNQTGFIYLDLTVEGATGGSGQATIDENGTITTKPGFNINSHYIKIVIRERVSGDQINKENDFELTGEREFSIALASREEESEIASSAFTVSENKKQFTFTNRYLTNGEYKYISKTMTFNTGDKVEALLNRASFAQNERAVKEDAGTCVYLNVDGSQQEFKLQGVYTEEGSSKLNQNVDLGYKIGVGSVGTSWTEDQVQKVKTGFQPLGFSVDGLTVEDPIAKLFLVKNSSGLAFYVKYGEEEFEFYTYFSNFAFKVGG